MITMIRPTLQKTQMINLFTWHSKFCEGIVPSSVVLTGFQVLSRVFLTWAVTHSVREVSLRFRIIYILL